MFDNGIGTSDITNHNGEEREGDNATGRMLATDVCGPHTITVGNRGRRHLSRTSASLAVHQRTRYTDHSTRVSVNVNRCYRCALAYSRRWTKLLLLATASKIVIDVVVNSIAIHTRIVRAVVGQQQFGVVVAARSIIRPARRHPE